MESEAGIVVPSKDGAVLRQDSVPLSSDGAISGRGGTRWFGEPEELWDGYLAWMPERNCFSREAWQFLQSGVDSGFLPCMKTLHNGTVWLFYRTLSCQKLSRLSSGDAAGSALQNQIRVLIGSLLDIRRMGFLHCENLDPNPNRIYIDRKQGQIRWLYYPVTEKRFPDFDTFHHTLRRGLAALAAGNPPNHGGRIGRLAELIADESLSLEELYGRLGGKPAGSARLISQNTPESMTMRIDRDEWILGRDPHLSDGQVNYTNITAQHCRINRLGGTFTVTDLKSKNGTFLNGKKLLPYTPERIQNGDLLTLAASDFLFVQES